jgi:hypothetical protein
MAQRTVVTLTDDIDGGAATTTLRFAVAGVGYEMDVNDKNAAKFEKALAPFIKAARKAVVVPPQRSGSRRSSRATGRQDTQAIRVWAQANGYQVNARGRISSKIIEAYQAGN